MYTNGPGSSQAAKEPLGHLLTREILTCQTETANTVPFDGLEFRGAIADPLVLHEHRPATRSGEFKSVLVGYLLVGWYPVVIGQCDKPQSGGSQQRGHLESAQAAIEKEVRQPGGM